MKTTRREFVRIAGTGSVGATLIPSVVGAQAPAVSGGNVYDVAVVGAGVFGAWTAYRLAQAGRRVALLDAYGPGNARSSSGGQTRVIRMGYGDQEIYTRWSMRSLDAWKSLLGPLGRPSVFQEIGVLWMARGEDPLTTKTLATLQRLGVVHERLSRPELEHRWPQIDFGPNTWAIHEPESGFLVAFPRGPGGRSDGGSDRESTTSRKPSCRQWAKVGSARSRRGPERPSGPGTSSSPAAPGCRSCFPNSSASASSPRVRRSSTSALRRATSAFARRRCRCGWISPRRSTASRISRGAASRSPPIATALPSTRTPARASSRPRPWPAVRNFVARRFPGLKDAPLVGSEVCQYENTSNGDFLIDRHPERDNVWLVGGGSGHGFKHGPAVGEHVTALILKGGEVEPGSAWPPSRRSRNGPCIDRGRPGVFEAPSIPSNRRHQKSSRIVSPSVRGWFVR